MLPLRRLAACVLGLCALQAEGLAQDQPNVVIISIDDAGSVDLGAYGGDAKTPTIGMEMAGHSARFEGDDKLVRDGKPRSDNVWRLDSIVADPGETHDLADAMPKLITSMMTDYEAYADEYGVLPRPEGDFTRTQAAANSTRHTRQNTDRSFSVSTLFDSLLSVLAGFFFIGIFVQGGHDL